MPIPDDAVTMSNAHAGVGRLVHYRSPGWPADRFDVGVIRRVGTDHVFVSFPNMNGGRAVACGAENLTYADAAEPVPSIDEDRIAFAESCCGKCAGASCYVDAMLGN